MASITRAFKLAALALITVPITTALVIRDDGNSTTDPKLVDYREVDCQNEGVIDHTNPAIFQWESVGAYTAWEAVLEGWSKNISDGRPEIHLANNISNFFHGPRDLFCEKLSASNKCEAGNQQCDDVNFPAGYFILNSLSSIYNMNANLWQATQDVSGMNNISGIADEFGSAPKLDNGISDAMAIDIALISLSLVAGPFWSTIPKAGPAKDVTNDLIKSLLGLGKSVLNGQVKDELDIQNGLTQQMQSVLNSYQDIIVDMHELVFSGSEEGNQLLTSIIQDGSMLGADWIKSREELADGLRRAINTWLIPLAWELSPDTILPFIVDAGVGCDEDPGFVKDGSFTEAGRQYITDEAMENGRFCHEGNSYWLLMGRDPSDQCSHYAGDPTCENFDSISGFGALVDETYGVSLQNVIVGSINSYRQKGDKNGPIDRPVPNEDDPSEALEAYEGTGIETPGIWNLVICDMDTVIESWYAWEYGHTSPDDNPNFPCNPPEE